jgi:putative transposase
MYDWHKYTAQEQQEILNERKRKHYPWHSPPHFNSRLELYHLIASCYYHQPIIGFSAKRMTAFSSSLLDFLETQQVKVHAWCVLPNHYHALIRCKNFKYLSKELGELHGRTAYLWNGEENQRGRKVFNHCSDRAIRSERHFWVTINYIHHNPVHHEKTKKWQEWPFSSVHEFIAKLGYEKVKQIWRDYPLLDYGKGWDEF